MNAESEAWRQAIVPALVAWDLSERGGCMDQRVGDTLGIEMGYTCMDHNMVIKQQNMVQNDHIVHIV